MVNGIRSEAPKMFQPTRRLALLINQYDRPETFGGQYHRLGITRGNKSVYQMEAALRRGKIVLRKQDFVRFGKCTRQQISEILDKAGSAYLRAVRTGDDLAAFKTLNREPFSNPQVRSYASLVLQIYADADVSSFACRVPRSLRYDHIRRIFPDAADPRSDAYGVLSFYASIADSNTLTYLFIRAHGEHEGAGIFPYEELLEKLDNIPGKKVIVALACYSGNLLKLLDGRATQDDYAVITSTTSDVLGVNWIDDVLNRFLVEELVKENEPLSMFRSKELFSDGISSQRIGIHLPFDVIL